MLTPYAATLMTSQADGPAFTGTSAGTILPGAAIYTFPASFLQFIGQQFHIRASGRASTTTGTNTITFNLLLGGSVIAATTGAITLVASQTNQTWQLDVDFTVRAVGSGTAANLMFVGTFQASVAILANGNVMIPPTAPAVGTGFDSHNAQTVDLQAVWSAASNSLTCHQYRLDALL